MADGATTRVSYIIVHDRYDARGMYEIAVPEHSDVLQLCAHAAGEATTQCARPESTNFGRNLEAVELRLLSGGRIGLHVWLTL